MLQITASYIHRKKGRVCLVTSRLGTGISKSFFTVYKALLFLCMARKRLCSILLLTYTECTLQYITALTMHLGGTIFPHWFLLHRICTYTVYISCNNALPIKSVGVHRIQSGSLFLYHHYKDLGSNAHKYRMWVHYTLCRLFRVLFSLFTLLFGLIFHSFFPLGYTILFFLTKPLKSFESSKQHLT